MDTWGYVLILIGGIAWLITRQRNKSQSFFGALFFIGVGILIGVYGAMLIINRIFSSL